MRLSRNLKRMLIFSFSWSVLFFSLLNWCLFNPEQRWPVILGATIAFGVGFSIAGHYFDKRDDQSKVRYNLWIRYALSGSIPSFIVGSLWVLFFRHEDINTLPWMGLSLVAQAIVLGMVSRDSIKGMPKKALFK